MIILVLVFIVLKCVASYLSSKWLTKWSYRSEKRWEQLFIQGLGVLLVPVGGAVLISSPTPGWLYLAAAIAGHRKGRRMAEGVKAPRVVTATPRAYTVVTATPKDQE